MLRSDFRRRRCRGPGAERSGAVFVRELADSELETLTAELARIAFGGDALAVAAAEREVLASLDAELRSAAVAPGRSS
jgi:hypothetical protein